MVFWTSLLIVHGLFAVALLGAITHQAVALSWSGPISSSAMSSTTPADSAHDRNQQGGDVRHHVYGWLCRHLRDLYRIEPSAPHLPPGDRRGRFSVEASPQRPGDVLVRLAA